MNIRADLARKRPFLVSMHIAVLLCCPTVGQGVENIRNVTWSYSPAIMWSVAAAPQASVTFDADLTPLEAAFQITSFSVVLLHAVGFPETLYRVVLGPLPARTAGLTARFHLEFSMACAPVSKYIVIDLHDSFMRYIHPTIGATTMSLGAGRLGSLPSVRESIGLAISDQSGRVSVESLRRDTFACVNGPDNGSIGVYFDPQGTQCRGTITAGQVSKVYVVAKLAGSTAGGIAGAEFRFIGMPRAWEAYSVPDPQLLVIGDPFTDGVTMGFVCRPPEQRVVLLYTVIVFAHADIPDVRFQIQMRDSYPGACPSLLGCNEPVFTKYCVEGLPCFVNARAPTPCDAPVAVHAASWGGVKALYR